MKILLLSTPLRFENLTTALRREEMAKHHVVIAKEIFKKFLPQTKKRSTRDDLEPNAAFPPELLWYFFWSPISWLFFLVDCVKVLLPPPPPPPQLCRRRHLRLRADGSGAGAVVAGGRQW